ncbi:Protoporphyrinogen oxidase [Epithele typhae]|uniref:Protoporphyrinogen oxidase n=1 Tax=Epithele typhae TaxID=378194 RepID=UPI0020081B2F|nr:Protoporphyrinogen oxidase [Epithele typhae]KAH9941888.1 Protoporphyrinogen oxidase [Epithele typhae]
MLSFTVAGGGISGLSTAFHLAHRFPPTSGARITLIEKASRLGGWVQAERVKVKHAGHETEILLESGPRTLRPNSKAILELVNLLDLTSSLLTVPQTAPAALNRFLHIPGTGGLTTIPTSLSLLVRSPLAKLLVSSVVRNAAFSFKLVFFTDVPADESVDAFMTRHFGEDFARTLGSALVHGIYAADSRLLSVRAAFPTLRDAEERGRGSLVRGMFVAPKKVASAGQDSYEIGGVEEMMKGVSVYSFKNGIELLTTAMEAWLRARENVELVVGEDVSALRRDDQGRQFEVTTSSERRITSSHLLSALPLPVLHRILSRPSPTSVPSSLPELPHLLANPTSSVTVVNLVFPPSSNPIHPAGFGYLVPRSATDYPRPPLEYSARYSDPGFTKVTMMLGGPYPNAPTPSPNAPSFIPTLLSTLQRQLGRAEPLPDPCVIRIRQHSDCIPTPGVGHMQRVAKLHAAVRERWGPNAVLVGAGGGRRAALTLQV